MTGNAEISKSVEFNLGIFRVPGIQPEVRECQLFRHYHFFAAPTKSHETFGFFYIAINN